MSPNHPSPPYTSSRLPKIDAQLSLKKTHVTPSPVTNFATDYLDLHRFFQDQSPTFPKISSEQTPAKFPYNKKLTP